MNEPIKGYEAAQNLAQLKTFFIASMYAYIPYKHHDKTLYGSLSNLFF